MSAPAPQRLKTISEYHQLWGLPKPEHPLISVIRFDDMKDWPGGPSIRLTEDFYSIALKRTTSVKMKYGQQPYDFDEGVMFFISPGQVFTIEHTGEPLNHTGWLLLIHPDFLWNKPLAAGISQYEFFSYAANEALFLSSREEEIVTNVFQTIRQEYHANIDHFSQNIIVAQLEVLLSYAERFYQRQFITRKITNHTILTKLEEVLAGYFNEAGFLGNGLPQVQDIAARLHVSPNYLSGLLRSLTGKSTQHHIHEKLIEKAKEKLSGTDLSVSEIAYGLGFEHPQSFNKLFRNKTSLSPTDYRSSFN